MYKCTHNKLYFRKLIIPPHVYEKLIQFIKLLAIVNVLFIDCDYIYKYMITVSIKMHSKIFFGAFQTFGAQYYADRILHNK